MIGERLKQAREAAGHSQTSLAELMNVQPKQLWRWETGKYIPEAESIIQLAKALNVSADYLLELEDDPRRAARESELSERELEIIMALRRDDLKTAMRAIINE
jgi:transcriptional regulator with XRE-family HTH domain